MRRVISIRDVAIDVVGTPSETSSFPCKELRPAERPREASVVEVAFLLMFPLSNGQWVSRPMPRRNQRLTVRLPNAPSPSVSATLPSTSSGPPSETSSFSCKELRQAERPREASAVEVAFLPAEPFVTPERLPSIVALGRRWRRANSH